MSLSPEYKNILKDAYNQFAANAADPDKIVMWNRSVRQINKDIQNETEIGQRMFDIFERSIEREGLRNVLSRLKP